MTVAVEPIDVVAEPVVLSVSAVVAPIDIDVTGVDPVVVDVSPTVLAADLVGDAPSVTLAIAGAQGVPGAPGTSSMVLGETPTGVVDGVNATFTAAAAFQTGGTALYLNGLREQFYTETTATTVTFDTAPIVGDLVTIDYLIA